MFTRVLFPTDFSQHAWRLLECLEELKVVGTEEIVLAHVLNVGYPTSLATDYAYCAFELKGEAERCMEALRQRVLAMGLRVRCRVEVGFPEKDLIRIAEEEGVSLIAIGTRGHGLAKDEVLGSVTHKIVQQSPVPVLVMKQKQIESVATAECDRLCVELFKRILLLTDFSPCADEALNIVKHFDGSLIERVVILHVQDTRFMRSHKESNEGVASARSRLESICKEFEFFGFNVVTLLRRGDPLEEIGRVANEQRSTLTVVGSKGRTALADVLLGSVADGVVRYHPLPALVVRSTAACASSSGAAA
jgi:nucleotide-binding universal stress UspA family protein